MARKGYHPQGGSEPGLNGLDNFYIPTSNLAICFFVLEDSSPSAETCFDTERSACPQAAAFLSRSTRIMPPIYVYTPFVSDLVLAKSVAVSKTPRQARGKRRGRGRDRRGLREYWNSCSK